MAKIIEQTLVITVSQMVKNHGSDDVTLLTPETIAQLEAVVAELAGPNTLVEIEQP